MVLIFAQRPVALSLEKIIIYIKEMVIGMKMDIKCFILQTVRE